MADENGIHAATCLRSGAIQQGLRLFLDVLARLYERAEVAIQLEASPTDTSSRRPADLILVQLWIVPCSLTP